MATQLTQQRPPVRKSWTQRFLKAIGMSAPTIPARREILPEVDIPNREESSAVARQLIADDRYAFVLMPEASDDIDEDQFARALKVLQTQMALVPTGILPIVPTSGLPKLVEVSAFYIDRYAVTNKQYQRFVADGGYENLEIWPREVWPSLMKFNDRTRHPGPKDWTNGTYPSGKADHPVTGICWYEASAYSAWVGKRLPTASEWQKAGGWPEQRHGATSNRYPWGRIFEPERANLLTSKLGRTVPGNEFPEGAPPNGIHQMTGNVWEWLADILDAIPSRPGFHFDPSKPLRRIAGGAYDTFLPAEASCQFITGQGELDRRENIGFRCVISADAVRQL